jgi:hypothetical protein
LLQKEKKLVLTSSVLLTLDSDCLGANDDEISPLKSPMVAFLIACVTSIMARSVFPSVGGPTNSAMAVSSSGRGTRGRGVTNCEHMFEMMDCCNRWQC